MAAYSAYRHVELDKIGFGKRRVLKPPGGGTSDMFASPPDQADSPRKLRAAATLQLGDSSPIAESDVPVFKSGNNAHSNIFGPVEPAAMNRHAHFTSNMPWTGAQSLTKHENLPVKRTEVNSGESNDRVSDGATNVKPGVNAVSGDGYDNGKSETSPQNGNAPAVLRNRVPPGGYSSGLW